MFLAAVRNPLYRTPEFAYNNAGTCALGANDSEGAEVHFREALTINPRLAPALLQMSRLMFGGERYLQARGYFQRYLEVGRRTAAALWLGIQIERELGDKDAVATYALKLEANFPDSQETRLLIDSRE